jgi:hypothetical protein
MTTAVEKLTAAYNVGGEILSGADLLRVENKNI